MEINKINTLTFWVTAFILFLPIIVLPPQFQPSTWSRFILFKLSLTFLMSFIFYKYFVKKNISISMPQKGSPFYKVLIVFLVFLGITALSVIFSEDIMFSFFASPVRAGGVLNLLFLFIFSLSLAIFINKEDWNKLFKILFAFGVIISLFGIVQYFNLFNNIFLSSEKKIPSFLGNSTFLAIYMMFLSILSLKFLLQEVNKNKKIVYAGLLGLFLFIILITGARATYLGIFAAFLYFLFFYPIKKNYYLKIFKISTAVLLVLSVVLVIYVNTAQKLPNFIENSPRLSYIFKNRLSMEIIARDLLGTRFAVWNTTISAIKEKPLLGWGPENFYIGFEKYYNPVALGSQDSWWDRPHNIFLEIAISSGLLALIFYIAFWIVLWWQLQKLKHINSVLSEKEYEIKQITAHALQAMFIGYLTALFFNFDSFATYLISYFFIGYSLYLISELGDKKEITSKGKNFFGKKPVAVSLLIVVLVFTWFWNIKPLYFAEKIAYADDLSKDNLLEIRNCKKALSLTENIWEKSKILNAYSGLKYTDITRKCVDFENEIILSENSISALKISAKIQPKYTRAWILMASFTNILTAREQNPEKQRKLLSEAREYLQKASVLSPKRPEILVELNKNYLISEDYQAAKDNAQKCIEINPSWGMCYWYLGISEIFLGDQENGEKHIQESKEKGYTEPALMQLGVAYLHQKEYKKASEVYDKLTEKYPNNPNYHAVSAALAKQFGDYRKAAYQALEVFRSRPENPENLQFIETLFRLKSSDPEIRASLAYIYREIGTKQKNMEMVRNSEAIYLQLTKEHPDNYNYHFNLAKTYKILDKYILAREEAITAVRLNPDYRAEVQTFLNDLPLKADQKVLP